VLDDSLLELYQEGIVDGAAVMARLQDPEKMKAVATR
jgi:hypothetical protein